MAPTRRLKRVVASQPGFLKLKSSTGAAGSPSNRRKRLNKNKKKSWNKHSDINDVDQFLQDIRHQERTTGGLLAEQSDESLFFLDAGPQKKVPQKVVEPVEEEKTGRRKASRPLRIDLILQHDSLVPPPKDVLAYQRPNAKKLRRIAQKSDQLTAKGVVTKNQKRLLYRPPGDGAAKKAATEANNNPDREYYDIWSQESRDASDPWYLQQTGKMRVKRPERLNEKPSVLPAVEVIAAGGSYNPDFFSHQALLQVAHEVEVKKQKEEDKLVRRLAVNKEHLSTEETIFQEQVEGLVEEEHEDGAANEEEGVAVGAIVVAVKKTERQRKKERMEKIKEQRRFANREKSDKRQQLFQLRSIKTSIKQQERDTEANQTQRKANQEAQKAQPRRLGKLKFEAQDMEVQLSDELAGSLRQLKPEGSVLKDRFKSLQKRNLIEPRDRAKFKRRLKVKYQEKRAFREIT